MITIATLFLLAAPSAGALSDGAISDGATSETMFLSSVAASPLTAASIPFLQDDEEEKPDKREEIKAALKELKDHAGARGKEDAQALALIDTLLQEFPKSGPKDRKAIVKGLTGCLKQKRKPTKEGVIDNKLHIASATALGRMGPESVKSLTTYMGHKNFAKDFTGKRAIILALGNTKEEDAIDDIADLLTHHEPQIQAAAAEALQQFTGADSKTRKVIFKQVLDEVARVRNDLDVNPTDPIVRQRYDGIAGPMLRTLQELSGHQENDPTAYRSWWNDNKKLDWDAAERGKDA